MVDFGVEVDCSGVVVDDVVVVGVGYCLYVVFIEVLDGIVVLVVVFSWLSLFGFVFVSCDEFGVVLLVDFDWYDFKCV